MIEATIENEQNNGGWDYPCLGISESGRVVLFAEEGVGTEIVRGSQGSRGIGTHAIDWGMEWFSPLKGSITLENK